MSDNSEYGTVVKNMFRISVSEIFVLSDIHLARLDEVAITRVDRTYIAYDDSLTVTNIPSNYELTVDLKTTGASSGNEHRFYLTSKNAYDTSMSAQSQPNPSVYVGFSNSSVQAGTRTTSTNNTDKSISNLNNTYHTFKIVKNSSTYSFYVDGSSITTKNFSNLNSYSEFTFMLALWSSGTVTVKNLKIKAL